MEWEAKERQVLHETLDNPPNHMMSNILQKPDVLEYMQQRKELRGLLRHVSESFVNAGPQNADVRKIGKEASKMAEAFNGNMNFDDRKRKNTEKVEEFQQFAEELTAQQKSNAQKFIESNKDLKKQIAQL